MQILKLNNVNKNEGVIYYRRHYTAEAEIELPNCVEKLPISFTIETRPLGDKQFDIDFIGVYDKFLTKTAVKTQKKGIKRKVCKNEKRRKLLHLK